MNNNVNKDLARPNLKLENYDTFTLCEVENDYYLFIYTSEEFDCDLYEFRRMKESFYLGWITDSEFVDWLSFKMGIGFTEDGDQIEEYDDGTFDILPSSINPKDTYDKVFNQFTNDDLLHILY